MDFHLATPTGDMLLFSSEDGRTVQVPGVPAGSAGAMAPDECIATQEPATPVPS